MMHKTLFAGALLLACIAKCFSAPQWPKIAYDAQNSGQSPWNVNARIPIPIGHFPTGNAIETSPALLEDGSIVLGSDDKHIYCLTSDGSPRWNFSTKGQIHSSPLILPEGRIVLGSDDHRIYCLTSEGALLWNFTTGGEVWSPTFIDSRIVVASGDYNLYCLTAGGTLVWKYPIGNGLIMTPAVSHAGEIVFGDGSNAIIWLSSDGVFLKRFALEGLAAGVAIGSGGDVCFGSSDFNVTCLTSVGNPKWTYNIHSLVSSPPAISSVSGDVVFAALDTRVYCFSSEGRLKWAYTTAAGWLMSSPIFSLSGDVIVGSNDGRIYSLSGSGEVNWRLTTKGPIQSSPIISASGNVICGSSDKSLWIFGESPTASPTASPTTGLPTLSPTLSPTAPARLVVFGDRVVLGASASIAAIMALWVLMRRDALTGQGSRVAAVLQCMSRTTQSGIIEGSGTGTADVKQAEQPDEQCGKSQRGNQKDEEDEGGESDTEGGTLVPFGALEVLFPITLSLSTAASNMVQIHSYLSNSDGGGQATFAAVMIAARVCVALHSITLLYLTFHRKQWSQQLVPALLHHATLWVVIGIMTIVDASHIRFLPWRGSGFAERSRGFPTHFLFKSCLLSSALSSLFQLSMSLARGVTLSSVVSFVLSLASFLLTVATAFIKLSAESMHAQSMSRKAEKGSLQVQTAALEAKVATLEAHNLLLRAALQQHGIPVPPPDTRSVSNPLRFGRRSTRLELSTIYDASFSDSIPEAVIAE